MTPDVRRQGQGDQFRRDLRDIRLRPCAEPAHPKGGGAGLHRPLFRAVFPGIRDYMEATKGFAKSNGYVQTLFGRKIHTPEINARAPARGCLSRGDQRTDPGHGGGCDPARDDPDGGGPSKACPRGCCCRSMTNCCSRSRKGRSTRSSRPPARSWRARRNRRLKLAVPLVVDAGQGANWAEAQLMGAIATWEALRDVALSLRPAARSRTRSAGATPTLKAHGKIVVLVVALRRCRLLQG